MTPRTPPTAPPADTSSSDGPAPPPPPGHEPRGERLHKVLAEAGVASRRHSEQLITEGRVTVNGQLVTTLPAWVDPQADRIKVDGRPIAGRTKQHKTYVIVNKPRRVVSTSHDPEGRPCVTELVPQSARLFPVGRLDAESTGLMLLTNDGDLAQRLTHPRYEVPKQYNVSVRGHVTEADLRNLKEGIHLAHLRSIPRGRAVQTKIASVAQVKIIGYGRAQSRGDRTNLLITLREGQNREIRRMLARLGYKVRRLERVAIGPIQVKGLGAGQWRALTTVEVNMLKRAAGLGSPPPQSRGDQRYRKPGLRRR